VAAHREHVEQRLGRVLVPAVAGVEDRDVEVARELERRAGAAERTTTQSTPIASSVSAVSLNDSPLETDEPLAEKLMTSADSRLAAMSKLMRVRVESSRKRLHTTLPRSVGTDLRGGRRSAAAARRCRGWW
jgi:hypothetical protein